MRDQLRVVLQPDDQLVKIKTVTAIDDHSDGEHPGVNTTFKADRCKGEGPVLPAVTIKHELLKVLRTCWARNQSLHDPGGMTQCVSMRLRLLGSPG